MKKIVHYIHLIITTIWLLFAKDKKKKEEKSEFNPFMRLNLQYFSEGGSGEGGEGGEGGSGSGGSGVGEDEPFATFKTQDDFNKRLGRAEKKGQKELAKSLGYDSVEEMQEALKKKKKPENNNPPGNNNNGENPVDVDALLESKLKEEREKTFTRLRNSEVKVQAKELGFADWEDALALADLSEVKEDEKGNITGVKEALEKLAEKKPHLLEKQGSNGGFGANIPNNQQRKKESLENIKKMASSRGTQQTQANNPWA